MRNMGDGGTAVTNKTTKARLLDAAEVLYREAGQAELTLRDLTERAHVNLAAVNYHFRSKDALVCAMIARRLDPINAGRVRRLERLEHMLGDRLHPMHVVAILFKSVFAPDFDIVDDPDARDFAMRVSTDYSDRFREFVRERYGHVEARYLTTLQRLYPDLCHAELNERLRYCLFSTRGVAVNANVLQTIERARQGGLQEKDQLIARLAYNTVTVLGAARIEPPALAAIADVLGNKPDGTPAKTV